jgi:hypothetical protein
VGTTREAIRLQKAQAWRYLSERQWGTVRECNGEDPVLKERMFGPTNSGPYEHPTQPGRQGI